MIINDYKHTKDRLLATARLETNPTYIAGSRQKEIAAEVATA